MFCFALFLNSARRLYFNPMDWNLKSLASKLPLCNDDSFSKFSGSKPPCSFTLICELTVHLYFNLMHYSFFLPQMLILKVCSSILYIIQIIWNLSMIRPLTGIHVHDPFFRASSSTVWSFCFLRNSFIFEILMFTIAGAFLPTFRNSASCGNIIERHKLQSFTLYISFFIITNWILSLFLSQ